MDIKNTTIGAIGLGQMGGGMAENQLKAGFKLLGFDLSAEAMERFKNAGGTPVKSIDEVLGKCDVVWLCVPGPVAEKLTPEKIIPNCRKGQILIDHCTIPAPDARKYAAALKEKRAHYLDVPISGGNKGADAGTLRMFAGGDKEIFDQCYPLFKAAGNPDKVDLFGPVGMGQVAKDVQQMTERMPTLARLELLAFGIRAGLTREQLLKALDEQPGSPGPYSHLLEIVDMNDKHRLSPMAAEWKYYLAEVKSIGMRMPMLEGVYEMLKDAPKTAEDNVHRPIACFWDEMMKAKTE